MSEYTTQPIATKRLERPASGRILGGVASGLARYFDLSPAFFRLGFVVLTLLGGSGVLLYLAALLIIPEEGKESSIAADALEHRRDHPTRIVALGVVAVALFVLLSRATFWPAAGAGWVLILIAGLVILWTYDARRGDRRSRRLLKTLLVICTVGFVTLVAALITAFTWFHVHPGDGVGTRDETPTAITQLQPSYHLGVGDLRLNLMQLPLITQETHVRVRVDVGNLRILVSPNQPVVVHARAKVGDVRVFQNEDSGRNAALHTGTTGELVIDASVGAGKVEVSRNGF
ncbi:MAG TPA: PspC domain-containing protein [Gaiellaceae bacterium]|nr:PspC domain-containing protein [Gaiellaceae bacterium]